MGNEQQSNKAEDNRQPTGLSASSASAVAELTSACAAKSSQAEGTAGKGADQSADNKVGSDQANTESAASSDQPLPLDQSEVSALKATLEQAIGELAAGKGDKTEVKAALAQAIGKLESIVAQDDGTSAAEAKAAEAPNSDEAVASADPASAPSADESKAVKKAEAQASGGGSADASPAADSQSEDEPHRCSSFFSWIRSQLSAFRVFAHAGKDNTERLLKYTERTATGIIGLEYSLGVYYATTEHTFADWQFQGATAIAAMFGVLCTVLFVYSANLMMRLDVLTQSQ